jgi:hypothetical protein
MVEDIVPPELDTVSNGDKSDIDFWKSADEIASDLDCYSVVSEDEVKPDAAPSFGGYLSACHINDSERILKHESVQYNLKEGKGDIFEKKLYARKVVHAIYSVIILTHVTSNLSTNLVSSKYPLASTIALVIGTTLGGICYVSLMSVPVELYTLDEDLREGGWFVTFIFGLIVLLLLWATIMYAITPPFCFGFLVFITTCMVVGHAAHHPPSRSIWLSPLFGLTLTGKLGFMPIIMAFQVTIPAGWNMINRESYLAQCFTNVWICSDTYYYYTRCPKWVIVFEFVILICASAIMLSRIWEFHEGSFLLKNNQVALDRLGMTSMVLIINMYARLFCFIIFFYGITFIQYIDVTTGVGLIVSSLGILTSQFVHMVVGNEDWYQGVLDLASRFFI